MPDRIDFTRRCRSIGSASLVMAALTALAPGRPVRADAPGASAAVATVRDRYVQFLAAAKTDPARVQAWENALQPDGDWPDIDYASKQRAGWPTDEHLKRCLALAVAANSETLANGPKLNSPAPKQAALLALHLWLTRDFQCPNWWYNQIAVPHDVGAILLVLGDSVPAQDRIRAETVILPRAHLGMTGQNRVWLAQNVFQYALLTGDEPLVRKALGEIASELRVGTAEGIQPDGSFHQHGAQQQFGNYGLSFAQTEAEWAQLTTGTDLALTEKQIGALRLFALDGLGWEIYRGRMDVSGLGRQLYPGAARERGKVVGNFLYQMALIDAAHGADYRAWLEQDSPDGNPGLAANTPTRNRAFYNSDMLVTRAPDYSMSLRMSSRRVLGNELVNSENLRGSLMGDGATYLYRRGDEFDDIFPVWDWRRLPGVTCDTAVSLSAQFKLRNATTFVGAVEAGAFSVAALDQLHGGVSGHKAWFCFDGSQGPAGYVCLGAGIQSAPAAGSVGGDVVTTLNQCLLRGTVETDAGPVPTGAADQTLKTPRFVLHDGIGYEFLGTPPAAVTVHVGDQSGNWKSVIANLSAETVTKPVFSLSVDHGPRPADAAFAYAVLPGVTKERLALAASGVRPAVVLLSNTPALQAVASPSGSVVLAVFWTPGALALPGGKETITTDTPCLLVLKKAADGYTATVADPAHTAERVGITIARTGAAAPGASLVFNLPQGEHAGRSVTRNAPVP